jgi:hypothetical protein
MLMALPQKIRPSFCPRLLYLFRELSSDIPTGDDEPGIKQKADSEPADLALSSEGDLMPDYSKKEHSGDQADQ